MPRQRPDFTLLPELGSALKELRARAGLTLAEVARRMGRSPGFAGYLSRLERGSLKGSSVALVAGFLRACRASMKDLVPLFDRYTAQPTVIEQAGRRAVRQVTAGLGARVGGALERYDAKTAQALRIAGEDPLEPEERELRVRKQARALIERGRLDRVVHREMDNLGVLPLLAVRKSAFDYAHRVWRILRTTRLAPGQTFSRRRKPREVRLAEAEQQARALDVIPIEGLRLICRVTTALFEQMERFGELDVLPGPGALPYIEKPLSSFCRVRRSAATVVVAGLPYRAEYLSAVRLDACRQMEAEGIKGDQLQRYLRWLGQLEAVALSTEPGSVDHDQRVTDLVTATRDPTLSRRVAELYFAAFERWRPRIFK